MIGRRNLLVGAASFVALVASRARAEQPILTDDGLYKQPWFLESFLDLADDLEGARKEGKRFVIMWELKGCPYCKETHFVNFAQARIADYVKTNFEVLQLNIIGSRKVTDFDGAELSEKELAAKYGVRFTPTFPILWRGRRVAQEPCRRTNARWRVLRATCGPTIFSPCFDMCAKKPMRAKASATI